MGKLINKGSEFPNFPNLPNNPKRKATILIAGWSPWSMVRSCCYLYSTLMDAMLEWLLPAGV